MKFTKEDKEKLSYWGWKDNEIMYMNLNLGRIKYYKGGFDGKEVDVKNVIHNIGRENWLSGVSRCIYHSTAMRCNRSQKKFIAFDFN